MLARRAVGTVRKLWKNGGLRVEAKMLYEGKSCTHGTTWARNRGLERRRELDVFQMGCLRSMCGWILWNRVRHEEESTGGKAVIW